ncbi:MAG: hypothetical protein ABEK50_02050 [bacterium]
MQEVNISNRTSYQRVIREFDRVSAGNSLKLVSDRNPEWVVEMVEELRPANLANYEFTEDDSHEYVVKLRKTSHPEQ